MASKMKDRKVRVLCALCFIRTTLFLQRGTFKNGILQLSIFYSYKYCYRLDLFYITSIKKSPKTRVRVNNYALFDRNIYQSSAKR